MYGILFATEPINVTEPVGEEMEWILHQETSATQEILLQSMQSDTVSFLTSYQSMAHMKLYFRRLLMWLATSYILGGYCDFVSCVYAFLLFLEFLTLFSNVYEKISPTSSPPPLIEWDQFYSQRCFTDWLLIIEINSFVDFCSALLGMYFHCNSGSVLLFFSAIELFPVLPFCFCRDSQAFFSSFQKQIWGE